MKLQKPQVGETYIERQKHFRDRAVIVKKVGRRKHRPNRYVFFWVFHCNDLTTGNSMMTVESFVKRFQPSWLKMRTPRQK